MVRNKFDEQLQRLHAEMMAMGGMIDLIKNKYFTPDQTLLFWHTGGAPELFAWADQVL